MAIVSSMCVSQTMVSQMMSVSQTVSVSKSVSVASIGLRLSLSLSLAQSVDGLEGAGNTRVELADSVTVSEVSQTVNVVKTKTNSVSVSVSVVRVSLGTPLTNVVSTAAVAGGLDSITVCGRPGGSKASVVSVSISRGQGGNSQAGGNQELVHDDTTHWSTVHL